MTHYEFIFLGRPILTKSVSVACLSPTLLSRAQIREKMATSGGLTSPRNNTLHNFPDVRRSDFSGHPKSRQDDHRRFALGIWRRLRDRSRSRLSGEVVSLLNVQQLLDRAEECRALAAIMTDETTAASYLSLAETYEALAEGERLLIARRAAEILRKS